MPDGAALIRPTGPQTRFESVHQRPGKAHGCHYRRPDKTLASPSGIDVLMPDGAALIRPTGPQTRFESVPVKRTDVTTVGRIRRSRRHPASMF
ncbi:hypothetical protein PU088_003780 [Citrobacter farmeri]|uniref:hypothetical protein n=1 Tax=Citrobacter amalonaticus TaxID=35703 RepID=UPI0012D40C47|nr:hypothetical protein [Citrobacter amalonaticus]EKV5656249.1 hypothetical protein [Citrobacter farmeri]